MGHIILLGDSIFDNARYVPDHPPVIEQLRRGLPHGWQASLRAVDGNVVEDVAKQACDLPEDATHLFVSAGGNDALGEVSILHEPAVTVGDALELLHDAGQKFSAEYRKMLQAVAALQRPLTVCTIYDAIPRLSHAEQTPLGMFNEIILREAFSAGLPIIDLRLVCNHAADFSPHSPIEPSVVGGAKITRLIAEVALRHDFQQTRSVVYCR